MTQPPPPPPPGPYGEQPNPYGQQPYGQQPGPYGQPYQPHPYGTPPKKSNKVLWIVLGVVGAVLLLCCGGIVGLFFLGVTAINEEEKNNTPSEVEQGEAFEHDDFSIESGWRVVSDDVGEFDIEGLTVTNEEDSSRSASLEFTIYRDDVRIADISCSSGLLEQDEKTAVDCYSLDPFVPDFDTVKVADSF